MIGTAYIEYSRAEDGKITGMINYAENNYNSKITSRRKDEDDNNVQLRKFIKIVISLRQFQFFQIILGHDHADSSSTL